MKYRFGACEIDTAAFTLCRDGAPEHVEPQVFDLISLLVEADGALVSRDRIVERVWGGRIVSEATISSRINAARRAVGDSGAAQAVIGTVPRRGLRLTVPVQAIVAAGAQGTEAQETGAQGTGALETRAPVAQTGAAAPAGSPPAPAPEGDGLAAGAGAPARAAAPPVRFATSRDGTTLAWTASGTGPALVRAGHWLSHLQLDPASPVWAPLLDRLGRGRRLIRYDQRGTGLSGPCGARFTAAAMAEDLAAVAAAGSGPDGRSAQGGTEGGTEGGAEDGTQAPAPQPAPVDVFASSQACASAILFAADNPGRVRRMVLYGGFAQGPLRRGQVSGAMAEGLLEMTRAGWGRGGSPFMKSVAALFMPDATEAQLADFVAIQLASADPDTAVARRRAIGTFDVTEALGRIRCPVLVAHCDGDALHPIGQSQSMAAAIPGAEFLALPGENHVPLPQTRAFADLMDAIDAFLAAPWSPPWSPP